MLDQIIEDSIPIALSNLKDMGLQVWNEDRPFLILFLVLFLFFVLLDRATKKRRYH